MNVSGAKLLTKAVKQNISPELCKRFEAMASIPKTAKTVDTVVIERNGGKSFTEIYSFRDNKGKLVQRISETKGDKNIIKTSNYSYTDSYGKESRIIDRKTYENGKLTEEQNDNIITRVKTLTKNILSKTSFNRKYVTEKDIIAEEKSLFGLFENKTTPKKIAVTADRYADNHVTPKKYQYTGMTKDEAKELAKDPYLCMRLLNQKDFLSTLKHKVYKDHQLNINDIKTYKGTIPANRLAEASYSKDGNISIILNKQGTLQKTKPDIVNSFNHEAQHCRQFIYIDQLDYTTEGLKFFNSNVAKRQLEYGKITDSNTKKYAEQMKDAFTNYTEPEKNMNAYRNNALEVDARKAGEYAMREYTTYADKLRSIIPVDSKQAGM